MGMPDLRRRYGAPMRWLWLVLGFLPEGLGITLIVLVVTYR